MRIAFIIGKFPSLSETFILNQITGLIDRGHQIDIYATPPTERELAVVHSDVEKYNLLEHTYYRDLPENKLWRIIKAIETIANNIYKYPLPILKVLNIFKFGKKTISLWLPYQIFPFLGKEPYDIIQCHFGHLGYLAILLKKIGVIKGKVITTFHGADISTQLTIKPADYSQKLFYEGDLFLPISQYWQDGLIKLGCNPQKIIVHRMGIDIKKFSPSLPQSKGKEKIVILSVARLVEKKGIEYGIRAVSRIIEQYPQVEYHIVGAGNLEGYLNALIQDLNVVDKIKLLGRKQQKEIIGLMQNADIMLAPSITSTEGDQEGIPVCLMEALAMELPVVSTQHSGIPELIIDGQFGFLVPEKDVDTLTNKLECLIKNPELRDKMGKSGKQYVEKHYDINILNDRLVCIYQKLLDNT